jgi:hypothetical protein
MRISLRFQLADEISSGMITEEEIEVVEGGENREK